MAVTLSLTGKQVYPGGGVDLFFRLVFSGSYSTGGETLNFSSFHTLVGIPLWCHIVGQTGYKYEYAMGTDPTNGKVKVMIEQTIGTNTPLGEHTAVAYAAGVTGDTVIGRVYFK